MSELIQRFHPLQYGTTTAIGNSTKFMYSTKEMLFTLDTEPKNLLKKFFNITPTGTYGLIFSGNNTALSEKYSITLNNSYYSSSADEIVENITKDAQSLISNVRTSVATHTPTIQDSFFIATPKNGGIIFWTSYSSIVYVIQNVLYRDIQESFLTFSAFDKTSTTARFFFDGDSTNIIVPEQIEIYTPSISNSRYDHRGYNLTRGGDTWFIYPYSLGNYSLVDTYYYDGGSHFLNDFEVIHIENRAFLCLNGFSNFLIELKIPEED